MATVEATVITPTEEAAIPVAAVLLPTVVSIAVDVPCVTSSTVLVFWLFIKEAS